MSATRRSRPEPARRPRRREAAGSGPFRLLLVELAPDEVERQFRVESYPLLMGLAAASGWEASWLAVGVRYDPTVRYTLGARDFSALGAEAARLRPSAVVVNERLDPSQERALARAAGGARLVYCWLGEALGYLAEFVESDLRPPAPSLLRAGDALDGIAPLYSRRVLNGARAPWAARPLVRVAAGVRCAYRTPAAGNRFYRDIPLPVSSLGCAFCGVGMQPYKAPPIADPLAFAVRYISAARRSPGGPDRFELVGHVLWRRLGELVAALAAEDVRGCELDFMPRVDELLEAEEALGRSLPAMAELGLVLRIYGMGVENFSPPENERLNKGVAAVQVQRAARLIAGLASRWPRNFRSGELSMILFTPWTTVEDLRVNIDQIARCPLVPVPYVLGQRLQLFPDRAVSRLARRDGLLAPRSGGGFYNAGCLVSFDQVELPWRFRRPEVAVLFQIGSALAALHEGAKPSAAGVERLARARDARREPLALFAGAVDAVAAERRPLDLSELIDRVL